MGKGRVARDGMGGMPMCSGSNPGIRRTTTWVMKVRFWSDQQLTEVSRRGVKQSQGGEAKRAE